MAGITVVLENDPRIDRAEKTMRLVDADPSPIVRFARWQELNREYAGLRTAAVAGRAAIRRLKGAAADAPTGPQKKALEALAAAVDGALARQNKIGDVIGRLAQYADNHQPLDEAARDQQSFGRSLTPVEARLPVPVAPPRVIEDDSLSAVAQRDADDVEDRKGALRRDEDDAAAKIDAAFDAC